MRVLRNRVVEQWHGRPAGIADRPVIGHTNLGGQAVEMRRFSNLVPMRGLTSGDLDEIALLAGQGVGLVDSVKGAASVIADITAQAQAMLERYRV
jgi:NAD(P)H-dependent flavin oxidoreductase YrpB (nitropropane dioxygenase family)